VVQFEIPRASNGRLWAGKNQNPIVRTLDNRITDFTCSICHERDDLGNVVESAKEEERKMWAAFDKHVAEKHSFGGKKHGSEDASQAAARIVREATKDR
jgi:hypothetical protein